MNIKSLSKLESILLPEEQYLWHAPVVARKPPHALLFIFFMACLFASRVAALGGLFGLLVYIALVAMAIRLFMKSMAASEFLMVTNKRILYLDAKMRVLKDYAIDNVKFGTSDVRVNVIAKDGEYTTRWLCLSSKKHVSHLKGSLLAIGRDAL